MSITKRRYGYQVQIQIDGVTYSKHVKTKSAAIAFESEIRRQVAAQKKWMTLSLWGDRWLEKRRREGIIRYPEKDESRWRRVCEEMPAVHLRIPDIKRRHIASYMSRMADSRLSRSSVTHRLTVLRSVLEAACDAGLIKSNPSSGVRVKKMRRRPRPWRHLSLEEVERVLDACTTDAQKSFFAVAIFAGLRKSELLHLRWKNVDLASKTLRVRAPLKTQSARREIVLLPPAFSALKKWHQSSAKVDGPVWPGTHGRLRHPSYDGGWRDRYSSGHTYEGVRTRAGLVGVRFHDLRHTFCSLLVSGALGKTFSLQEVKLFAGHSSISVTQKYAHLAPDGPLSRMKELAENMNKIQ